MQFRKRKTKSYFSLKTINPIIRYLTISDIMIVGGFGLVLPIFAVYITDTIDGGSVEVVGIEMTIYLLTKSLGQVPVATVVDKIKGEKDDFWLMFSGSIGLSVVPLLYIFITTPLELYLVQFLYGLLAAVTYPSWMAIFTRHIDPEHEGVEWSAYQTMVDLGSAGAATMGGFIAFRFGFTSLFVVVSITVLVGSVFLMAVKSITQSQKRRKMKKRKK
jgi:MFS family permease